MREKSEHFEGAALTAMRVGDEAGARRLLEVLFSTCLCLSLHGAVSMHTVDMTCL